MKSKHQTENKQDEKRVKQVTLHGFVFSNLLGSRRRNLVFYVLKSTFLVETILAPILQIDTLPPGQHTRKGILRQ